MRSTALLTAAAAAALTIGAAAPASAAPKLAAPGTPVYSGMEIRINKPVADLGVAVLATASKCTLGAVVSSGRALTAGHCGKRGTKIYTKSGAQIGTVTANLIGAKADIGVISLIRGLGTRVDSIDWSSRVAKGSPVSKSGITTGTTRGTVIDPRQKLLRAVECPYPNLIPGSSSILCAITPPQLLVNQSTYVVETSFKSQPGDSGSGVRNGSGQVVGIVSSIPQAVDAKGNPIIRSFYTPVSRVPGNLR
ncbi:MAG: trypsin-like serine protease [Gordonia sp. (in: high G+C Gram-positive bacteria)]|uniref:trypsin-like serine protease n=1 Tax=Gordonia sp. (in: high G+C Gram-positive bacteria) TaxID=84139 RepID=UPI0039E474CE